MKLALLNMEGGYVQEISLPRGKSPPGNTVFEGCVSDILKNVAWNLISLSPDKFKLEKIKYGSERLTECLKLTPKNFAVLKHSNEAQNYDIL